MSRINIEHTVKVKVLSQEQARAILDECWKRDAFIRKVSFSRRFVELESYVKDGESPEQAIVRLDALIPKEVRSAFPSLDTP